MNTLETLDKTIRLTLYRLGTMSRADMESFIEFGRKCSGTYRENILQNSFVNKYLEPFGKMDAERQQNFLYAVMVLHGMSHTETVMQDEKSGIIRPWEGGTA